MNEKESIEKNIMNNIEEMNIIPDGEVCSHEFSDGCILREDQA